MKIEDSKNMIWGLMERLRSVVFSRNLAFSALRLLFLKYALDNYIGASSKEDMQQCVRAQKMFALRDVDNGIETVIPVLQYIDRAYELERVLSNPANIEEYARELFGVDRTRQKRNTSETGFRSLIEFVGTLDLEEKENEPIIGKNLVDAMVGAIETNFERNSYSGKFVTNVSVSTMAKELLQVNRDDTFVDFAAGSGVSTLLITGDARPTVANVEINGVNAAVAAMLFIMYDYKRIRICIGDSLSEQIPDLHGNKLFVDPPLMGRLEKSDSNEYSDMTLAALNRVMHNYLSRDGEAVVVVPGGTLFQGKKQAVGIREELVQLGMLKAVITLPPLWYATSVNTNLLLISKKEMPQSEVLFIDATREAKASKSRGGPVNSISVELCKKIADAVSDRIEIDGFSCLIHQNRIREKDYNLVPATYLAAPMEEDSITMEEVNAQLAELYRQLMD